MELLDTTVESDSNSNVDMLVDTFLDVDMAELDATDDTAETMSYMEKVTWTRALIRKIMHAQLCEITQRTDVRMKWSTYWRDVVRELGVAVTGWPEGVPFCNLSHGTSSLARLELLCVRWLVGTTRFRFVSLEELDEMEKAGQFLRTKPVRPPRADDGLIRGRRRDPEKRSKKLRPYAIKSPLVVPDGADDM